MNKALQSYSRSKTLVENKPHTLEDLGDKSVASRTREVGLTRGFTYNRSKYEREKSSKKE